MCRVSARLPPTEDLRLDHVETPPVPVLVPTSVGEGVGDGRHPLPCSPGSTRRYLLSRTFPESRTGLTPDPLLTGDVFKPTVTFSSQI